MTSTGIIRSRGVRFKVAVLLFICFNLFILVKASAQDGANAKGQPASRLPPVDDYRQKLEQVVVEEEEYFPQDWDSFVRFMPSRGAGSQSGKIGIVDSASEYSYEIKAYKELPVEFGVSTRYIGIDNTTVVKLPANLTAATFGVEATLPFFHFNKTYITVGINPSFFSQNGNLHSSSFCLHQRYFLIYQQNAKLTFIAGADVYPGHQEIVQPIIGFIYQANDRLTFNITPDKPEVSYLLNKKVTLFAEADIYSQEYAVKKDNLKDVALTYKEMHLGAGLRYNFNKNIQGSLAAGGIFNRSIAYNQENLGKVTVDDGFYSEFRFEIIM